MPATVVIFSCAILALLDQLEEDASTEKSPQPGHQVGWSAAISFLVSVARVGGAAAVAVRRVDMAETGWSHDVLRCVGSSGRVGGYRRRDDSGDYLRARARCVGSRLSVLRDVLARRRSRISFTFQVRPSVLLMRGSSDRNSGRAAAGELAVAVEALVVHLHDEDVLEAARRSSPGRWAAG